MAAERGTLLLWSLQPHQGYVIVTAVWPVLPVNHNLLDPKLFFKFLWHQGVIIPDSNNVVPSVVTIPERQGKGRTLFQRLKSGDYEEKDSLSSH